MTTMRTGRFVCATLPGLAACAWFCAAAAGQDGAEPPDEGAAAATQPGDPAAVPPVPPELEATPEPAAADAPDRLSFNVRSGAILTFEAGLDDSPGDVSIWRAGGGVGAGYWLTRQVRLSADFNTELSWYDFNEATGLVPGTDDPLDRASETSFGARALVIQNEDWAWFIGGRVTVGAEEGADLDEAITGGGVVGARWQMDERFALNFGLAASTRLEESPLVLPLIGFDWQVDDKVRVSSTGPGVFDATDSLGVRVFAEVSEGVEVMLGGRWKMREFRLDESETVASEGVFRDARFALDVGVLWEPAENVSVGVIGGVIPWQEYGIDDADGDEISEMNSDPAGFVAFGGRVEF